MAAKTKTKNTKRGAPNPELPHGKPPRPRPELMGHPIMEPHREYDFGQWCGKVMLAPASPLRAPRYNYDQKNDRFWMEGAACWEDVPEMRVFQVLEEHFRPMLFEYFNNLVVVLPYINSKGQPTTVQYDYKDIADMATSPRLWRNESFKNGFATAVRNPLLSKPVPLNQWATGGSVLTFNSGSPTHSELFNPNVHNHRSAMPVKPPQPVDAASSEELNRVWMQWFDPEQGEYLKQLLAEALLGMAHRKFLTVVGLSGTGKSCFEQLVQTVLGTMVLKADESLFNPKGNHNDHLTSIIERQPRLVIISECQGTSVDATLLNELSGGDTQTARRAYDRVNSEGQCLCLPIFIGESMPIFRSTTSGTLKRQRVVRMQEWTGERDPALFRRCRDPKDPLARGLLCELIEHAQFIMDSDGITAEPSSILVTLDDIASQDPLGAWLMAAGEAWTDWRTARELASSYHADTEEEVSAHAMSRRLAKMSSHFKRRLQGKLTYFKPR